MAKTQEMQRLARLWKEEQGKSEVDVHELARWAVGRGWPAPAPIDPIDRVANGFARALREEIRYDTKTGQPYRANHAYRIGVNQQGTLWSWIDIDEAKRGPMRKSLQTRREQMVGDGLQLSLDADHWNSIHPNEQPIQIELDFTEDVEWRKNAPDENDKAS